MSASIKTAVGAALLTSIFGGVAGAQVLEEVVVTAQKRSENIRDVPISITAYTATALQERAIGDVSQLSNSAPNVTLDAGTPFSGSTSVLSAYIRGIGQNDFAFNLDPGVGIYLDGVYLARTVGGNQDLLDVERIEVLKGPQGTLFGRNTIGGAIQIVTRDPGDEFKIKAAATTGSFDRVQLGGTADIPLSDSLKSSVTFSMKKRQGYMTRIPFPVQPGQTAAYDFNSPTDYKASAYDVGGTHEGGDDSWNARVKLKWDNGGRARFIATADFSDVDQEQLPNKLLGTAEFVGGPFAPSNPWPGQAFNAIDPVDGHLFAGLYNFCINSTPAQIAARNAANLCGPRGTPLNPSLLVSGLASVNVDANPNNNRLPYDSRFVTSNIDETYANGNNLSKLHNWGVAGTLEFDLSDALTLKSITAYRSMHWTTAMDLDGSPLVMLGTSFDMNQTQVSEELQLNGTALNDTLKYVVGLYYFRESGDLHDFVTFSEGLLQIDGPNDLWTRNYAGFAQIDWRATDLIGVTLGGRYTKENKEFEGFQADLDGFNYKLSNFSVTNPVAYVPCGTGNPALAASYNACRVAQGFPDPNYALRYYIPGTQKKDFNNFAPKVGVQLHPNPDMMVYGSWSKGYKTGGWTTRLSNPIVPAVAPDFDEEKATTYELGVKTQLLEKRLNLSAAIFQTDYDGIQLNFQEGVSPTIRNAGDARLKGGELELNAAITDAFTVSASFGYNDAKYTRIEPQALVAANPFQLGTAVGGELPKTPKTKLNISPRYEFALAEGAAVVLIADYTRTSSMRNDTEGTLLINRPGTDMFNAGITYKAGSGNWDVTVGGTNLSDERYLTTGQTQVAGGQIYGTYNRPREWYLTLKMSQ
jgi:iron complex outermembrane receptor protein